MRATTFTFSTIVLGAGLCSAFPSISISTGCQDTLKGLLVSPEAECLNLSAFLSLAIGSTESVLEPVDNWLRGLCSVGSCSDETLASLVNSVLSGCASDLSSAGYTEDMAGQVTSIVQQVYPTARKAVCLMDDSKDQLCATQMIANVQNVTGVISPSEVNNMDEIVSDVQAVINTGLTDLTCTSCVKQLYNIAEQDFPDIVSEATGPLGNLCGASFLDGSIPADVSDSSVPGVFNANAPTSGAMGLVASTAWRLFALSAMIAFWL